MSEWSRGVVALGVTVVLSLSVLTPASAEPVSVVSPHALADPAVPAAAVGAVDSVVRVARVAAPSRVVVRRVSPTVLRVSWSKVPDAGGYRLYVKKDGKYVAVPAVRGKALSHRLTGLTSNTTYTFRVRAVKKVAGKKVLSGSSYWVSANTWTKAGKYRNATAPKFQFGTWAVQLTQMDYFQRYASVNQGSGTKLVSTKVRYISSNPNLVKVSASGELTTGTATGTTKVRAVSHNGLSRVLKVKVVDYATKQRLPGNYYEVPNEIKVLWKNFRKELGQIASYVLKNQTGNTTTFSLNTAGNMVVTGKNRLPAKVTALIRKLLKSAEIPMTITLELRELVEVKLNTPVEKGFEAYDMGPRLVFISFAGWFYSTGGLIVDRW